MNVRSCCLLTRAEAEGSSDMQIIVVYGTSCIKPAYTRSTNICLKLNHLCPWLTWSLNFITKVDASSPIVVLNEFPLYLSSLSFESVSVESNEETLLATFLVDLRGRNNIAHYARKVLFGKLRWRKLFAFSALSYIKFQVVEAENLIYEIVLMAL